MGNVDASPIRRPSGRPAPAPAPTPAPAPAPAPEETPPTEGRHRLRRAARPTPPPGRGDRDLRILWWVNAIDGLGSQASGLVLPLLLLELGHSPGTAGSLASAAALTGVVLGPLVAIPADRGRRRRLMTGSAACAALGTGALALTCLGRPALWIVVTLALSERLCAVAYEAASRGALVHLAATDELPRAAAGLQVGDQVALVLGPALGGVLFQLARPLPFLADALSYGAAALGVRAIRAPLDTPPAVPGAPTGPDGRRRHREKWAERLRAARAGLLTVAGSPVLRLVLVWTSTAGAALTLLFYTALFQLGADARSAAAGLVLAASGAAGLLGALVAAPGVRRLGAVRLLTLAAWLLPVPCGSLLWADGAVGWAVALAGLSLLLPLITVVLAGVAIAATPVGLQSRTASVLASVSALATAGAPALAAALVSAWSPRTPALLCTAVLGVLALYTQLKAPAVVGGSGATGAGTAEGHE
ncbi:MFS transporter [Streptomyces sp. DSM 15324]|uniref:MFS transporter n=1 Tax=Streptomyces sp. DSM 15324 TaxID=1739111 RepID=UPI0007486890|nr:MFS transporter [Streptomyces sp. DSM 15324]KUO09869.1 hypothetical protein AQJ58_22765 [Streptomyces sp. DSM 15324]